MVHKDPNNDVQMRCKYGANTVQAKCIVSADDVQMRRPPHHTSPGRSHNPQGCGWRDRHTLIPMDSVVAIGNPLAYVKNAGISLLTLRLCVSLVKSEETQRRKGAKIENPHPSAFFENHRIHQNREI